MRDDVIDLLHSATEPDMCVDVERVLAGAGRTRRRRRVTAAAAVVGSLALVAGVGNAVLSRSAPLVPAAAGPRSAPGPAATTIPGPGPTTAPPGPAASIDVDTDGRGAWGPVHVMSDTPDRRGLRPVVYLTHERMVCIGRSDSEGVLSPSVCAPAQVPSDAFGNGFAWSSGTDLLPDGESPEYEVGLVPRDVTKVVLNTERGDVTAVLSDSPSPSLGRVYWAKLPVGPLGPGDDPAARGRVAYRGSERAFSCDYWECVIER